MPSSEERVALNEALFRDVNENVATLRRQWLKETDEQLELVCECGNGDCIERLAVPFDVYEQVRAEGSRFVVRPGHELPNVERVLVAAPAYAVVEKDAPTAARIAELTDPRS